MQYERAHMQSLTDDVTVRALPSASGLTCAEFIWGQGEFGPEEFSQTVCAAYSEAFQWRRNIFSVSSGRSGKAFVSELARLLRAYADGSALKIIALTAVMLLAFLLLQRLHQNSKAKEHVQCLERRLGTWKAVPF